MHIIINLPVTPVEHAVYLCLFTLHSHFTLVAGDRFGSSVLDNISS